MNSQFQHHVPRFYLGGWSTSVNGLHKRVWVYEKNKTPRPSAIRRTGGRDNTYAVVKSDGSVDLDTVEEYLKGVESRASQVFRKIIGHSPLNSRDKRTIAVFVSVFYRRDTYTFDNFVPEKLTSILPALRQEMYEQADAFEAIKDVKGQYRKIVDKAIDLAGENLNSVASQSILYSEDFADAVFKKLNWCFLCNKKGSFVTSDCPVVFDRHRGIRNYANGHILFPISSKIVLWMTQWPILTNCYIPVSSDLVDKINARLVVNAHNQVFANYNDPNIKNFVDNYLSIALPRAS